MFPGIGTVVNVAAVLVGSTVGALAGDRLPERTRDLVTDALGLVTLLIAALSALAVTDRALVDAVGESAPVLIVLGALVIGGIIGSLLRIEDRLESFGAWLQARLTDADEPADRQRFVQGFVTASLVFCVGPLTLIGSINDGIGEGAEELYLKSALDGFASIAFAASFGWGVAASVISLVAIQGSLTLVGVALGDVLADAELAALTATGGLVLVGVALRLLRIRQVQVGDFLPALVVAPLLVLAVSALR